MAKYTGRLSTDQQKEYYTLLKELQKKFNVETLTQKKTLQQDEANLLLESINYQEKLLGEADEKTRTRLKNLKITLEATSRELYQANGRFIESAKNIALQLNGDENDAEFFSKKVAKNFKTINFSNANSNLSGQQEAEKKNITARIEQFEEAAGRELYGLTEAILQDYSNLTLLQLKKHSNDHKNIPVVLAERNSSLRRLKNSQEDLPFVDSSKLSPEQKELEKQLQKEVTESYNNLAEAKQARTAAKSGYQAAKNNNDTASIHQFTQIFTEVNQNYYDAENEYINKLVKLNNTIKSFNQDLKKPGIIENFSKKYNIPLSQIAENPPDYPQTKSEPELQAEQVADEVIKKKRIYKKKIAAKLEAEAELEAKADEERLQAALEKNKIRLITNEKAILPTTGKTKSAADSYDVFKSAGLVQNEIDYNRQLKNEEKLISTKEERQREALDRELKQEDKYQQRKNESAIEYENRLARAREERKAEQLAREEKQEARFLERKEEMNKRYLEQKADSERRQAEKIAKLEELKNSQFKNTVFAAAGTVGGMLGVYGAADSVERGMRTGVEFSSNLNLAQAIGGYSDADVKKLEENALKVSAATKATASELPLLQIELAKLGKAPQEIIKSTGSIVKFSATFQTELAQTAGVAAKSAKIFGVEMPRMLDIMGATFRNTSIKDLAQFEEALASGSAMAKALGYSAEQSIALLATAINNGQKADEASRGLQKLLSQAKNSDSEFARYFGGTANNFDEIISRLNAMTAAEKELALTKMKSGNLTEENAKNLLVILMNSGKEISDLNAKLTESNGIIEGAYDKSMQSLKNEWDLVTSEIETKVIKTYKDLEPQLLSITKSVQNFFEALSDPDSSTSRLTELIGDLTKSVLIFTAALKVAQFATPAVGKEISTLAALVGKLTAAFQTLSLWMSANPYIAATAAVIALAASIYTLKDSTTELLEKELQRNELAKSANEKAIERANKIKALAKEFEELSKKENRSIEEEKRLNEILKELNKTHPGIIENTNLYAGSLDEVQRAGKRSADELERLYLVQKRLAEKDIDLNIQKLKPEITDAESNLKAIRPAQVLNEDKQSQTDRQLVDKKIQRILGFGRAALQSGNTTLIEDAALEFEAFKEKDSQNKAMVHRAGYWNSITTELEKYQETIRKINELQAEKKAINNPLKSGEEAADSSGNDDSGNNLPDSLQSQFDLELEKLRLKAELSKTAAEWDKSDIFKQREALNDEFNYQNKLAEQKLSQDDKKSPAKTQFLTEEKNARKELNKGERDRASVQIDSTFEQRDESVKKQEIELALKDQPANLQYKIELEKALTLEKQLQLTNQYKLGTLSEKELEIQLKLLNKTEELNIVKLKQSDQVNALEKEQLLAEIDKTKSKDFDFASEEKQLTLKYKIEVAKLDPQSADYAEKLGLLKAKADQEKEQLIERKITVKTTIELLNLQNRRSDFAKDYSLDRQIMDKSYDQKTAEVNQNTNLSTEEKTAQKGKLAKEKSDEQKKLVADYVNYYSEITKKSFNMMQQLADFYYNQELNKAKKLYDEKSKLLDKEYNQKVKGAQGASRTLSILEAEHEKQKEKLEAERENRLAEIEKKKQKWAVAQAAINIALAITRALAESSLLGWINAAAATVTGGIQIAQIEAQQFNTGKILVNQSDNPNDRILAWIGEDESIINPESSRANAPVLNEINEAHGEWTPKTPSIQQFIVQNYNELVTEVRLLRTEAATHAENISGTVKEKDFSVAVHNQSQRLDDRIASQIVANGNKKSAKLTVFRSRS